MDSLNLCTRPTDKHFGTAPCEMLVMLLGIVLSGVRASPSIEPPYCAGKTLAELGGFPTVYIGMVNEARNIYASGHNSTKMLSVRPSVELSARAEKCKKPNTTTEDCSGLKASIAVIGETKTVEQALSKVWKELQAAASASVNESFDNSHTDLERKLPGVFNPNAYEIGCAIHKAGTNQHASMACFTKLRDDQESGKVGGGRCSGCPVPQCAKRLVDHCNVVQQGSALCAERLRGPELKFSIAHLTNDAKAPSSNSSETNTNTYTDAEADTDAPELAEDNSTPPSYEVSTDEKPLDQQLRDDYEDDRNGCLTIISPPVTAFVLIVGYSLK